MQDPETSPPAPVVLLASAYESFRAIETVLAPSGYVMARVHTGQAALAHAASLPADVIIIDADLRDPDGLSVCRALRSSGHVTSSTPILLVTNGPTPRQQRVQAIRAGASECVSLPIDGEEFALRLEALVAAKRDVDHARAESLVDRETGLYNARGLARRALELGTHAYRRGTALACVVFAADVDAGLPRAGTSGAGVDQIVSVFRSAPRGSDAVARLGPNELAIIAPDTDAAGALRLAERVASSVDEAMTGHSAIAPSRVQLRAGYAAVSNFREASLDPASLLEHASKALALSRGDQDGSWIRPFVPHDPPSPP